MTSAGKHSGLPRPLAEGDPIDWFLKYEICCVSNNWGEEVKAKKLPTPLEGEPLAIRLELSEKQQGSYETAKARIIKAMAPIHFDSLDDFRACKLQQYEVLPLFYHELRQLVKQAMPEASEDTQKYCTNL